jgi:hypothetical protein
MSVAPGVLVEFAAAPGPESGGWATRRAPVIFRAGRYEFADAPPFEMAPDDIKAAAQSFSPVPLYDTHRSETSIFHGKLGELAAVEPTPDGAALAGTLRVPRWLDQLFQGVALPLSATWDRATKRLKNVALLTNPRIADAAAFEAQLEAAFAAAHPEATPVSTEVKPPPADADARLRELERREAEWKAEREELRRQAERTAAQFAAEQRKGRKKAAAEFAAALIHGERAADGKVTPGQFTPAARPALQRLAEFCLAHQDEHGDATFSNDDGTEARAGLLAVLREAVANLRPRALSAEELRGSAEFGHDPGEKPGDEFEAVDKAVDAEIERQRKARGQQTNGRGA